MLEAKALNIGYTKPLLPNAISGTWNAGEVVVLLGDNGVGKSTFLKTLAGLINPLSGEASLASNNIGWVDSSISKGVYLSVKDFLGFGIKSSIDEQKKWMTIFDLNIEFNRFLDELSDGQFRKLCIIRQLLKKPEVLFLDEPTVYLDVKSKNALIEVINNLKQSCLIFCTTHDLYFAEKIKTQVLEF